MARDTGFPTADAENDFARQRRRADVARLVSWLRREPDDVNAILPFDEVVAALGKVGEKSLGLQVVTIESIVGSVDRTGDFDRLLPSDVHSLARSLGATCGGATTRRIGNHLFSCIASAPCIS